MANSTGEICVNRAEAPSWGIQTFLVNGSSELYPGHIVTQSGHTYPDVGRPDADADVIAGVAITCSGISVTDGTTKIEIDTYYADNEQIEVAMTGSHLEVWVYVDDDEGTAVVWTPVFTTGADDDGFVELQPAIDVATAFVESGLQAQLNQLQYEAHTAYVGRLYKNMADQGSTDTPNKVVLC